MFTSRCLCPNGPNCLFTNVFYSLCLMMIFLLSRCRTSLPNILMFVSLLQYWTYHLKITL